MARDGIDMLKVISASPLLRNNDDGSTFHLIDKGIAMEISSTYIRDEFANGGKQNTSYLQIAIAILKRINYTGGKIRPRKVRHRKYNKIRLWQSEWLIYIEN